MSMYSVLAGNDGYRAAGPAWVNNTPTSAALIPGGNRAGYYFTGLPTLVHPSEATLTIQFTNTGVGTILVRVVAANAQGSPEAAPAPFSLARNPGVNIPFEVLVASFPVTMVAHQQIQIPLDGAPTYEPGAPISLLGFLNHAAYTGVIPLTIQWAPGSAGTLTMDFVEAGAGGTALLETGAELPFLTGLDGQEYAWGMSRVSECPRTGFRGLRENWVRDGWNNMLLDPRGYNPADYVEKYIHYERPPVNDEG